MSTGPRKEGKRRAWDKPACYALLVTLPAPALAAWLLTPVWAAVLTVVALLNVGLAADVYSRYEFRERQKRLNSMSADEYEKELRGS